MRTLHFEKCRAAFGDIQFLSPTDMTGAITGHLSDPLLKLRRDLPQLQDGGTLSVSGVPAPKSDVLAHVIERAQTGFFDALALELVRRRIRVTGNGKRLPAPHGSSVRRTSRKSRQSEEFWQGRDVLVTGASSGLGRAAVDELAFNGARVFALARRKDKLEDLCGRFAGRVFPLVADVSKADDVARALTMWRDKFGKRELFAAIHCAGGGEMLLFEDARENDITDQIATNVLGSLFFIKAVQPHLAPDGRLAIVGSAAAFSPWAGGSIYVATKSAQYALALALADSYRRTGAKIAVTAVLPGFFDSELWDKFDRQMPVFGAWAGQIRRRMMPSAAAAARQMLDDVENGLPYSVPGGGDPLIRQSSVQRFSGQLSGLVMPRFLRGHHGS